MCYTVSEDDHSPLFSMENQQQVSAQSGISTSIFDSVSENNNSLDENSSLSSNEIDNDIQENLNFQNTTNQI